LILLVLGLPVGRALPGWQAVKAAPLGRALAEDAVIRQVSVDQAGVVAYIKGDAIYTSGRGGSVRRQVAAGNAAPRAGGKFVQFLDLSSATVDTGLIGLGNDLRIVFKATIAGGSVSEGIFLFSESQGVLAIVLPGDIAPNTGGGVFSAFPGRVLISSLGTIMFRATVTGGKAAEGIFFVPRGFLNGEANIDSVTVQGDAAPETGGGANASFVEYNLIESSISVPVFPPVLKVDLFAYIANVEGGKVSQGLFLSAFAVVSAAPLQLELQPRAVALVGDDAAGLRDNSTYAEFEDVVLTRKPELVFRAKLAGGEVSEGIFQIAFLGPIQLSSARVLEGDKAPVSHAKVTFAGVGRMAANNSEQLIFEAMLQGDGPSEGLFLVTLGPLTLVSETLSAGDRAPGTDGGTFGSFGPLSINDDGLVVFQAGVDGGKMSEAVFSELAKHPKLVDGVPR
jgi:hypothetical protein